MKYGRDQITGGKFALVDNADMLQMKIQRVVFWYCIIEVPKLVPRAALSFGGDEWSKLQS